MSIQVPQLTDFDPFPGDLFAHRELFDTIDADGSGVIKKSVPFRGADAAKSMGRSQEIGRNSGSTIIIG